MSKRKRRRRHTHSKKWDRCVRQVKKRGTAKRAGAVCTKALGKRSFMKRARRRRNPARKARVTTTTTRTRIVRRSNPRRPIYALVARRKGAGERGKLLRFTGTKFTDHGNAKLFPSLEELRSWAKRLRREYGAVLNHYDLYSQTRYVK